jgi:hypothetical protein
MRRTVPELGGVALCLLSIGISEASCERSFSLQGLTHSKVRNRMNNDLVEGEMRIRFNKGELNHHLDEELSDDSDDEK